MNERDDNDLGWATSIAEIGAIGEVDDEEALDTFLDHLLAGTAPADDAPAWSHDVALLVRAARAPAQADELAGEQDIVARMVEARRTTTSGVLATVTRLADRRAEDRGDRHYRAKHAAARLEASRHPVIRTVGRVLAMKAAAVATVAVVGVAAAAATTGIVATVVVPALTEAPPAPEPAPTTERRQRTETTSGARDPGPADEREPAVCPMVPTCTAPPSAVPSPTTTVAAAEPTTPSTETDSDDPTAPSTSTTVATTTTSTTVGASTTIETTTTTTSDPDPGPSTLATGDDGNGGGTGGGTP